LQRSSLVPILDKMADAGIIERRPVTGDRRSNAVWATPAGHAVVTELTAKARETELRALEGLEPGEIETLRRLRDRVIDNLRRLG